jgi:hypothetical protein
LLITMRLSTFCNIAIYHDLTIVEIEITKFSQPFKIEPLHNKKFFSSKIIKLCIHKSFELYLIDFILIFDHNWEQSFCANLILIHD